MRSSILEKEEISGAEEEGRRSLLGLEEEEGRERERERERERKGGEVNPWPALLLYKRTDTIKKDSIRVLQDVWRLFKQQYRRTQAFL